MSGSGQRTVVGSSQDVSMALRETQTPTTYEGVVTTGIYCRAGCPATPLARNTRPFMFAAAAEAKGFRPCLRCRPDTLPGPASWVGSSELVCRAMRLVSDGFLDDATEADLARRVGVTERHMRRLFAEHVGASADAVARSRRSHFARRLLDETDMRIADIAFASGFRSVRQMNRVMKDTFRFTPTELRRRRRRADRTVTDGGLDLTLPLRPPLDADGLLTFLRARAIPGVEAVADGTYRRTVVVDSHPGVIELRPDGDVVSMRAHLPSYDGLIHVVAQARRMLDLDADPETIDDHLGRDPLLGPSVRRHPGVRVPGAWDPFELTVRAIVGQQVSVAAATTIAGRIVERYGTPVPGLTSGLTHTFPAPETLADADLTGIGMPGRRAGTLRRLAEGVASGGLRIEAGAGLAETIETLCATDGMGPWTAHYVAMRACGEPDAFPSSDLGLRRAAGGMSVADLEERSQGWRPWRAYAAVRLWTRGRV